MGGPGTYPRTLPAASSIDADDVLNNGTKRFVDREIDIERRPPAPWSAWERSHPAKRRLSFLTARTTIDVRPLTARISHDEADRVPEVETQL